MNLTKLTEVVSDIADLIRDPSPAACWWGAGLVLLILAWVLL